MDATKLSTIEEKERYSAMENLKKGQFG